MSSKKKSPKHASTENIILLHSSEPLDLDLTDSTESGNRETTLDITLVSDLEALDKGKNLTILSPKRSLENIPDAKFLDVFKSKEKRIIHPEMDDYSILNSFREIRTHLLQKSAGKNFILMVVSLTHNMGATFTSVNIGAAFSYEGQKTSLLIDCNQRKHKLNKYFDIETKFGLSDYLHDPSIRSKNIIYPTGVYRMNFIPIGNRKIVGEEFLSSERMQQFIGILKSRYPDRYVILNAPPLEESADAAILSEIVDYIVIVVPYGRVSKERIHKAVKLLPEEKIAGIILNKRKNYVGH